jgi:2-amino-4-hydroxy-6-hydroxymethyldihydropteridine diphosphokinase
MKLVTAYLGLGSNLHNKKQNISNAIKALRKISGINVTKISHFYKTKPVGVVNQPDFINAVIKIKTNLSQDELITLLLSIEKKQGRIRSRKWGPRIIDIDLLLYSHSVIKTHNLIVPHSRLHKRYFVLKPLTEIAPGAVHPILKKTSKTLLKELLNGNSEKNY